jgi:hypothetical protein
VHQRACAACNSSIRWGSSTFGGDHGKGRLVYLFVGLLDLMLMFID